MVNLIACLGQGKGTWGHIVRLITDQEWSSVLMISNEWGKEKFKITKPVNWVMVNNRSAFDSIKDEIKSKLPEGEIALSIVSGSGKEHIAVLAALREIGREFKLVTITRDGVKYY